jgi:glycosyltransferase involved in cell wall biosynthesis
MLELLRRLRHGHDVGLWLIGTFGEQTIEQEAMRFIEDNQLAGDIRFLGRVEYPRFFSYLSLADIGLAIVDPERFVNNVPTKLFEYMFCELPVVSVDTDGVQRYVDGTCGVTVPWEDGEQQAMIVEELLNNHKRRMEMGNVGRQHVENTYNWETVRTRLLELYQELDINEACKCSLIN